MFDVNLTCAIFVVMFLLFMVALKITVLKPIADAIEKRQEKIKSDLESGNVSRATAAEIVNDYEKRMHDTHSKAQAIVNEVLTGAQKERQSQVKLVHDEGQVKLQAAKEAIAVERANLVGRLAEEQKELVGIIVKKLLGESVSVLVDTDKARQVLVEEAS